MPKAKVDPIGAMATELEAAPIQIEAGEDNATVAADAIAKAVRAAIKREVTRALGIALSDAREAIAETKRRAVSDHYRMTVVSEVGYAIRRGQLPDSKDVAIAALLSLDWPDDWWLERSDFDLRAGDQKQAGMSVAQWIDELRKHYATMSPA